MAADNVQYPRRSAGVAGGRFGPRRAAAARRRKGRGPSADAAPPELTDQWFETLIREVDEAAARLKVSA